jgi:hypothetical protein
MPLPEMIAEARRDHRALWNKVDGLLPKMRRIHLRDRAHTISHLEPWCSPRKNNWLLHFSLRKAGLLMHPLVWGRDHKGRVFGLIVTPTGSTYHLNAHMIHRYGERFDPTSDPVERLQSFFMENHYYAVEVLHKRGPCEQEVRVGMNHGLGLGRWNTVDDIIHVDTFVSFGQLFPQQWELMERLDAQRAWDSLTPGQQLERLRRAKLEEERRNGTQEQHGRAA